MGSVHALVSQSEGEIKAILRAVLGRAVRGEIACLDLKFTDRDGVTQTVIAGRYERAPTQAIRLRQL